MHWADVHQVADSFTASLKDKEFVPIFPCLAKRGMQHSGETTALCEALQPVF
jgi:hypothetical protein